MSKRDLTESRLQEALQRLLKGSPKRTKASGRLTLNKINKEAGLGNSYIHKFPDFIDSVKPQIDEFNKNRNALLEVGIILPTLNLTLEESLKADLKRETNLKEKYRQERDDYKKAKADLEALCNSLMFRIHELQQDLREYIVTPIKTENGQ
ncbi:hypothetical protein [Paraglaciecola sp. 2405UD69-4]|uniref:hypothetical protein n=1 Tax=Paraglaciecola sp. 2405UD69-4 TaxID=3391836 RepID=UPI0039C95CA5